ncbi:hypothetical protein KI387_018860, partial [Taxus chinensis]
FLLKKSPAMFRKQILSGELFCSDILIQLELILVARLAKIPRESQLVSMLLMPFIQQVVVGRQPVLNVYGNDYPTKDGTAVRDYIHVVDLADGHISALRKLFITNDIGCAAYNLGTGRGTSVLELVAAFEKVSGKKIPLKICARRQGDATAVYADTEKAARELGW